MNSPAAPVIHSLHYTELPDDLQLLKANSVPLSAGTRLKLERQGKLKQLRILRGNYYRVSAWRRFLAECEQAAPVPPPFLRTTRCHSSSGAGLLAFACYLAACQLAALALWCAAHQVNPLALLGVRL